jgi:hypothetical protein
LRNILQDDKKWGLQPCKDLVFVNNKFNWDVILQLIFPQIKQWYARRFSILSFKRIASNSDICSCVR